MKKKLINSMLHSPQVRNATMRLGVSHDNILETYYDSGMEYLARLEHRICNKRIFDRQFKAVRTLPAFRRITPRELFTAMRTAIPFWFWWSTQLWGECYNGNFDDTTELSYRLKLSGDLIPDFILKKIIDEQESNTNRRAQAQPHLQASATSTTGGVAGKGAFIPADLLHGKVSRTASGAQRH